jgi:transposase
MRREVFAMRWIGDRGSENIDDRRIISGIILVIRNGLRWRDAPAGYGPPKT